MDDVSDSGEWVVAHRRAVLLSAFALISVVVAIRLLFVEEMTPDGHLEYKSLVRNMIDGLISTIIVSGTLATFFWWVRSPSSRIPAGGEILPDVISRTLERSAKVATEWEYLGHTGRYVRSRILPTLGARSKAETIGIKIRFIIINPTDSAVCAAYADYRSRSRSSTISHRTWDTESVQADLIATVICLIQAKAEYPNLQVHLGLLSYFGLWRVDKSNEELVVTQEDPQQPAYRYRRGSRFFAYHRQECEEAWHQAKQIEIKAPFGRKITKIELYSLLLDILGQRGRDVEPLFKRAIAMASELSPYA